MPELDAIIAGAVQDLHEEAGTSPDDGDAVGEVAAEEAEATEVAEGAEEVVAEVVEPAEGEEVAEVKAEAKEDPLAKELGLKPRPDGKENRIPYSRVQKIVQNQIAKATEPLAREVTDYKTRVSTYEERLAKVDEVERIMFDEPAKFIEILKTLKGYPELLGGSVQAATHTSDTVTEEPQPDLDLGDGKLTYSPEGLKRLRAWDRQQTENVIGKRLKPFEDERAAAERIEAAKPYIKAAVMEAKANWPRFNEDEEAILKEVQGGLTLEAAWRKVSVPKLSADRDKMRAEIIQELKKQPTGTAVAGRPTKSGPTVVKSDDPIEDAIRNSIRGLKAS